MRTVMLFLVLVAGCEKQPASLVIEPATLMPFMAHGKTAQLKAQTRDDRGMFLASVKPAWESKDPSVATVSADGLVTPVGSGKTQVVGTFQNVSGSVPVEVHFVGALELEPAGPQKVKLGKYLKINVKVKDDRGNLLPDEKVTFKTIGPVIDVDPDGTIITEGPGEGTLVVTARDKSVQVKISVVD